MSRFSPVALGWALLYAIIWGGSVWVLSNAGGEFVVVVLLFYLCDPSGVRRTVTMGELLPLAFGPANLGKVSP